MKKIFALLFSLGVITVSFAQGGHYGSREESRDVILGRPTESRSYPEYGGNTGWNNRGKEAQMEQIRRSYDFRIEQVQRDRYLRPAEKRRQIRMLERQRENEIRSVERNFSNRNVYDRRY